MFCLLGCSNMGYGIRHSVIKNVLSQSKAIRQRQSVRKNLNEVLEETEYAGTVSHENILSAQLLNCKNMAWTIMQYQCVVITTFKIIILDFDEDGKSIVYDKPREVIYYGDLERIIPGYWGSDVHISFVDHDRYFSHDVIHL